MKNPFSNRLGRCVSAGIVCSVLALSSGCRERGSSLTHEEAISAPDSAAVANQPTAPQRTGPDPLTAPANAARGPEPAGVQHGFADASGGHSLPRQAEPAGHESKETPEAATPPQPAE